MPRISLFLCSLAIAGAAVAAQAPRSIDLLRGGDFSAMEYVTTPARDIATVCHANADGTISVAGKPVGYLATKQSFKNYRFHAEWKWPANAARNSNSGMLIHIATGPKDRAWPECFQVQTKPGRAGDLLPMAGAAFSEKLSTAPDAKTPQLDRRSDAVEAPVGQWNTCDVVCRNGVVEVILNGVLANTVTHAAPDAGTVGFQLEGTPYELRNVSITPID